MPEQKVTIEGKEYILSPLRCKHLRQISAILREQPTGGLFSAIERWMPFVSDSIKIKTPDFDPALIEEMTLQEFNDVWKKIIEISGIALSPKGEQKPMESTGEQSTDVSQLPSAGPIQ